jgi:hypothetical protein
MASMLEIPDDGKVTIKIGGTEFTLDAYRTHNSLVTIRNKITDEEKPIEDFHEAVVQYFAGQGIPNLTHFQADRLVTGFEQAVDELGKVHVGGRTHSLPTILGQAPSTSQAA